MGARIIDGRAIGAAVRAEIAERVARAGITPGFVDVLIGEDPASRVYVGMKNRAAASVGMQAFEHYLPANVSRDEVLAIIDDLNKDSKVHGALVQSPLPRESTIDIFELQCAIDPLKDIDGLHPVNQGLLALGKPRFVSATPFGVWELLRRSDVKVEGAHVVVVGRSILVGRPLSILLSNKAPGCNATVTLCHTGTEDLGAQTRRADILVVAAGTPRAITADMVKPGAVVIDVGTTKGPDGTLIGDVDFDSVVEVAGAITPVPGGVGPLTVAMLLHNTATAAGC